MLVTAACGSGDDEPSSATAPSPSSTAADDATTSATTAEPTTTAGATTATTTTTEGGGCAEAVAGWPLRRRLALLVVIGVDPSGSAEAAAAVEDEHVGGVFVGGNATDLLTSGALTDLRLASPTGLLVAVDEEGGRVQRIEGLDGEVPSARTMAATMTPDEVRALAERRGRVLAEHGVTVDLAPVVDVSDQPERTVIGDRSWSADPEVVVTYARAYAEGLLAAGVTPVLKHFPGHGAASGDTHEGAATTPPLDALRTRDLVPYERLLPELGRRAAVMLGHLDVPGLTEPDTPASLSPAAVGLLRTGYGFGGVVMTDDLASMASITSRMGPDEAAVRALAAGVDVVLLAGADVPALLDRLEGAVADGTLTEPAITTSVTRVLALRGLDPCAITL
ncbi:MAG TPA: glycoside hydrolase family 3 N-terminal domain-containing protein [Iamia sp.]|nr:glycoside hydrolase family 3 N-terminal domain-containing protein [Iamia sp.]